MKIVLVLSFLVSAIRGDTTVTAVIKGCDFCSDTSLLKNTLLSMSGMIDEVNQQLNMVISQLSSQEKRLTALENAQRNATTGRTEISAKQTQVLGAIAAQNVSLANIERGLESVAMGMVGDRQLLETLDTSMKTLTGLVQDQSKLLATQIQKLDDEKKVLDSLKTDPTHCKKVGVFHAKSPAGHYKLTFEDARELCGNYGATIATLAQLQAAWNAGLDVCACGWLADKTMGYPIHKPRRGCGSFAGINARDDNSCLTYTKGLGDVYCYKS